MRNIFQIILIIFLGSFTAAKAQVPKLNSYPSASAVIFLDFDGHRVSGTSWNYMGPLLCNPSGLDNTKITEIFNRVAEDYRPFNINITTDSTEFFKAPINQRTRIIITTSYEWYGVAGGVAFTGSFSWYDDTPAFVFSSLHNYKTKDIAEASSHEAGHTLGLSHQAKYDVNCNKVSEYNSGEGSGEIGWAPIMGAGYSRNLTLWHNGPNSYGCSNFQSDLSVITSALNGFGYRIDDHGTTFESATVPVFNANNFEMTGVVSRNTDQDYFQFSMPSNGRFQLNAIPYNVGTGNAGSNLDLQVTLYNNSKEPVSVYNPGTLLNSVADTSLNAGIYYLKVEGKGNQFAPEYASLGSYSLLGRIDVNGNEVLPLHRFQLNGSWVNGAHALAWNIEADEVVAEETIEVSYDGRSFEPLRTHQLATRQYQYQPERVNTPAYYRIRADFEDGKRYYSNTVVIRQGINKVRPQLITNPTASDQIRIESPASFQYQLMDMNGRVMTRGTLQAGVQTLASRHLTAGVYLIQYTQEGQQWSDKLIIR